jgi:hypothetical protein
VRGYLFNLSMAMIGIAVVFGIMGISTLADDVPTGGTFDAKAWESLGRMCLVLSAGLLVFGVVLGLIAFRKRNVGTSLLSIAPRISKRDDKLVASTSLVGLLVSLTLLYREIVVDPKQEIITIRCRFLWFFKTRTQVRFSDVAAISYDYENWNLISGMGFTGDSLDCFSVKLGLHNGKYLHLFRFFGAGTFENRDGLYPDWVYWDDYLLDVSGSQEEDSRAYVNLLQHLLDVPLA